MWLTELRNKEFSNYCEYLVCFKLKELGWDVFRPLIDRYIDIIAIKKINNKLVLRTVQVKSSRIENEDKPEFKLCESYGLTHEPKDLLHSGEHFFIWVFINKLGEANFFVIPVEEFIKIRSDYLPASSRRRYSSVLMRDEWRHGTDRLHPHFWKNHTSTAYTRRFKKYKNIFSINNPSWEVEGSIIDYFLNNWNLLELNRTNCSLQAITSQEIEIMWRSNAANVNKTWQSNNKVAYGKLRADADALRASKKLDEVGFPE